jgi:hypothetical protein
VPDTSYKLRSGRLDWRLVDGEVIALDLERAEYLAINPSGAELWPLLVEGATRDQLVRRLQDTFAIDEAQARGDVDAFVAGLESQQLLDSAD